jgi:hypothetical protein
MVDLWLHKTMASFDITEKNAVARDQMKTWKIFDLVTRKSPLIKKCLSWYLLKLYFVLLAENDQVSKQIWIFNYILNLVINFKLLFSETTATKEGRHKVQLSEIILNIGLESVVVKQLN